jgi:hypothetical protein
VIPLLWKRLYLNLRGIRFRERHADDIPEDVLMRIDTCWLVAVGLSLVDPMRACDFQTRSLLLALRAGEPYRIARSLALEAEAAFMSFRRNAGPHRSTYLLQAADELAQRSGEPHAIGMVHLTNGVCQYLAGRWVEAHDYCNHAEGVFRARCTGVAWELDTSLTCALWSLTYMGHIVELRRRRRELLKEAQERGDLYAMTNLSTYIMSLDRLGNDDPHGAEKELGDAKVKWSQHGFHVQHHNVVLAETLIDLYQGNGQSAWQRITDLWSTYRRSQLLLAQQVRVDVRQSRARSALAAAAAASDAEPYLRAAGKDAKLLQREKTTWAQAISRLTQAGIARMRGDETAVCQLLESAGSLFDDAGMVLYAAACRWHLGDARGGQEGKSLIAAAQQQFVAQEVKNPSRMRDMLAPGFARRG